MHQGSDKAGPWLLKHFGDLALRLAGVRGIVAWRAVKGEVVAPHRFPDGLIEVTRAGRPDPETFLVEIELYADPDAESKPFSGGSP